MNDHSNLRLAAACPPFTGDRSLPDLQRFLYDSLSVAVDLLALPMRCVTSGHGEDAIAELAHLARDLATHLVANVDLVTAAVPAGRCNVSVLFDPSGAEIGRYVKTHQLPHEGYTLGRDVPVFETAIGALGMIAGTDHYFPELMEVMAMRGAEIIVWSQTPELVRDTHIAEIKMRARAIDNNAFVVAADFAPTREYLPSLLVFHNYGEATGRSYVINNLGDQIAATEYEPGIAVATTPRRHQRNVWHCIRGISNSVPGHFYASLCEPTTATEMPTHKIKIALISPWRNRLYGDPQTGQPVDEVDPGYLFPLARRAAETGADLVALGEYVGMKQALIDDLRQLAAGHSCYISIAGWGTMEPYHALLIGRDGEICGDYAVVTDGVAEFPVFDTAIGRIAFKVCRDIRQQELDRIYGLKCVDLVLWPTMASAPSGELLLLKNRGRAIDNGIYIVTSHYIVSDPGLRSHVVDPYGEIIYQTPFYEEGVYTFEFTPAKQGWFNPENLVDGFLSHWDKRETDVPQRVPAFERTFRELLLRCRRPELYGPIVSTGREPFRREDRQRELTGCGG